MNDKKSGKSQTGAAASAAQRKQGQWSEAAVRVLRERYLLRDENGNVVETPDEMCWRVASAVAAAEVQRSTKSSIAPEKLAEQFYNVMVEHTFLPNSPTLMNAGKGNNLQLSACYVVPVEDSLPGIFEAVKHAALIHQSGGGCISGDAHVFTTFCGVEAIATLYERVQATGKVEELEGDHAVMDVRDLNIQTMALNPHDGRYEPAQVTHLWRYDVPLADQIRVRATNGLEVTTSRWHPFMVFDGTKFVERRADGLLPGDILPTPNVSVRDRWPHSEYKVVAGTRLDEEIAWLLGYYLGDGSLGWAKVPESNPREEKLRWRLFDGRTASLEHARDILARRFGVHISVQRDARGLYSLATTNAGFIEHFRELLEVHPGPKDELPFPEMVAKSPLSVVGGFLAGLVDSDGHVDASRDRVTFATQSQYLARKVHTLCALLGLAPSMRSREPQGKGRSVVYEVKLAAEPQIADLRELIGAYVNDSLKSERLAETRGEHEHSTAARLPISFSAIEDILQSVGVVTDTTEIHRQAVLIDGTEIWLHRWKEGLGVNAEKLLRVVRQLQPLAGEQYQSRLVALEHLALGSTTVASVEQPTEHVPFYDFTVADHSTYLAGTNGLTAIHNTGFSFSRLRPEGSMVASTHGVASGPVSFMKIFDGATEAVKQGGCVVPETRVATSKGLVQIGTLGPTEAEPKSWHAINAPLSVATDEGSRQVEEFYHNGLAAVRRIRTNHGYGFTGTLEHRVRVIDEHGQYVWRHLKEVRTGDWVVLQKHTIPETTDYRFEPSDRVAHFNAASITFPERPTAELGEFIGYLIGDGCINYYNPGGATGRLILTVAEKEADVAERLLHLARELFGVVPQQRTKPNDASVNYFFNATELVAWLEHIGVTKPSTLNVKAPEIVFRAGAEFARGFVRGLFTADGTISKDGYPQLYSISQGLVEDVQQLLLALGVPCTISVNSNREDAFGRNPVYRLRPITYAGLREFAERIGFMSVAKNERLDATLGHELETNDVIPNQQYMLASLYAGPGRGSGPGRSSRGANRGFYRDIQHYLPGVASPRQLTRLRLQSLAEKHEEVRNSSLAAILTSEQFYDQVVSIEEDEAITVDLSVEQNHTYIANGFVSHNTRRGANMGILRVDHPDVLKFIDCKRDGSVTNFNISVAITDAFMQALETDDEYDLIDPHTHQVTKRLRARDVMDRIVSAAWATGDPGLVFIDRANASTANPTPEIELLEATNPCGEQYLGPYDACNLGSINLGLFVKNGEIDWTELERVTRVTTRLLDDVIDINPFPLPEVHDKVHANRRIGLGVMGWAEMLFELGMRYDSDEAIALGERVMSRIRDWSTDESAKMAVEHGAFPNWERSVYKSGPKLRNSTRTTVAPTGSISILADCSSGIEPIFALAFQHRVKQPDGSYRVLDFVNPFFKRALDASDIEDKDGVLEYVKAHGSLHGHAASEHPALAPYVTAHEIAPAWHIRMQAAFQKGVDNSISKTINLPNGATTDDVYDAYMQAWNLGCLGITVFRDGSKGEQVLNVGVKESQPAAAAVPAAQPNPARHGIYQQGVKVRPEVVSGYTRQVRAPEGKVNVTLNSDEDGLLEVFVNVGKAGSDVAALAEALGRLISLHLRIDSPLSQNERAQEVARQLGAIGGSTSIGFGQNRVRSLPDAVARALEQHIASNGGATAEASEPTATGSAGGSGTITNGNGNSHGGHGFTPGTLALYTVTGNLCPQCGNNTLYMEEGCKKCVSCGHSEC
ncbi:MAG: Ribonucleotide reductase of class II (coenzyme B12-dependent) [Ktedonobacterales bacterium]|nr:MAG: Ribonucleotide reductase of class II (coenzyme B12-dependent) [Ktedonobacterales bacterium]